MKCELNGKECPIGEKYGACFYCGQASVLYGHLFRVEEETFKLSADKDYEEETFKLSADKDYAVS